MHICTLYSQIDLFALTAACDEGTFTARRVLGTLPFERSRAFFYILSSIFASRLVFVIVLMPLHMYSRLSIWRHRRMEWVYRRISLWTLDSSRVVSYHLLLESHNLFAAVLSITINNRQSYKITTLFHVRLYSTECHSAQCFRSLQFYHYICV